MKLTLVLLSAVALVAACSADSISGSGTKTNQSTPLPYNGQSATGAPAWDPRSDIREPVMGVRLGTEGMTDRDVPGSLVALANSSFEVKAKAANGLNVSKQPARLAVVQDLKTAKRFLSFPYEDSAKVLLIEANGNFEAKIAGPSGTQVSQTFNKLSMVFNPLTGDSISSELSQ